MNELSLFSGVGGGLLATTHFLGWETVGYVEWNDYCQRVLRARICDGYLHSAPIFGDVRAFIGEGYAASYTGLVDVLTAGFPCQPFSTAGRRLGESDARNMWPETAECIRIIQPRFCLLENVPGLLSSGYFGTVLGDLATCGYDALWCVLSASAFGAPHKRSRLFVFAYTSGDRWTGVLHNKQVLSRKKDQKKKWGFSLDNISNIADEFEKSMGEPALFGMDDGLAHRVDRLKAIGNGQVPVVVRRVFELLTEVK